jgi:preprotein translocase subunit Sec61beta
LTSGAPDPEEIRARNSPRAVVAAVLLAAVVLAALAILLAVVFSRACG